MNVISDCISYIMIYNILAQCFHKKNNPDSGTQGLFVILNKYDAIFNTKDK